MTFALDISDLERMETTPGDHVLSVYFGVGAERGSGLVREFDASLGPKIQTIERAFEESEELREFKACLSRIRSFLGRCEPRERTFVLFCGSTGRLWVRQVNMRLPNDIRWGVTAHIRPLLEALDEFERYGIVVAGESVTRLVLAHAGKIHQHARIGRKENEDEEPYLRRIIEAVQEFAEAEEAGRLILAGAPHVFFRLHRLFPAPLRNRVVALLGLSIDTTNQQLSEAIRTVRERAERTGEMKQVTDLLTLSAMGKKVTVGLQPTLDALNERRVWRLVYSDTFSPRGGRCEQCGRVYSNELQLCTHCNAALRPLDDLADAMVAQALDMEATVEQLRGLGAKRLDEAGGVGAFLRF